MADHERPDGYRVGLAGADEYLRSETARHVRPDWLAKQHGISTHELSRRLGMSVADLDARLDRAAADTTAGLAANPIPTTNEASLSGAGHPCRPAPLAGDATEHDTAALQRRGEPGPARAQTRRRDRGAGGEYTVTRIGNETSSAGGNGGPRTTKTEGA